MSAAAQSAPDAGDAKKVGFSQNRRLAAAVLAAVVVIFTPLGAWRSLRGAVNRVERQFYTGIGGRGAIVDYLKDVDNAALGLVTVGAKYDGASDETGELRVDRSFLLDAMEGRNVSEYAGANALVVSSFGALRDKLLSLELAEQDVSDIEYYVSQFEGAEGAISHAGYNEETERFTKEVYNSFPTRLIGQLFGIDPPEQFR